MRWNRYKNVDPIELNAAIESSINNSIKADFKAGTGDEEFYSMILQDLLDSYGIVGKFNFRDIGDRTTLYINNRSWVSHYSRNSDDYRIGYIVRYIETIDRMGLAEPCNGMLEDINGFKIFNLEDLKLHPKDWEQYL